MKTFGISFITVAATLVALAVINRVPRARALIGG